MHHPKLTGLAGMIYAHLSSLQAPRNGRFGITVDTGPIRTCVSPLLSRVFFEDINSALTRIVRRSFVQNRRLEHQEHLYAWGTVNAEVKAR